MVRMSSFLEPGTLDEVLEHGTLDEVLERGTLDVGLGHGTLGLVCTLGVEQGVGLDVALERCTLGVVLGVMVRRKMTDMGYVVQVELDDGILVRSMDRMGCRSSIWH